MARLCEKDKQEEEDRQKLKENAAKVEKQNVAFYSPYKNDGILPYHQSIKMYTGLLQVLFLQAL